MDVFLIVLGLLIAACFILHLYTRQVQQQVKDPAFRKFQQVYLIVYLLAVAGDWLQGPHVYALYESYGIQKHEIEILFIAGFGSSMIFGTIVASLADKYGRRNTCLLYGILYGVSCITKHFPNFQILFVGRLLAGMATSILFSAFESWLVNEHQRRNFEPETLGTIFANAYFGNSVVAILSGITAQIAATKFGYVAPFDSAILVFIAMCFILATTWSENHGDANAPISQSFLSAYNSIKSDRKIFLLGIVQALFEASMYVFVLEWTPALTEALSVPSVDKTDNKNPPIPHGYVFASYMVAMMMGSNSFKVFCNYTTPESFMRYIVIVAAFCLSVPVFLPKSQVIMFSSFLIFEFCIGIFWPAMATMRSKYVPEEARATIMNYFRIPLNLIVVVILLRDFHLKVIFMSCVFFLVLAAISMSLLHKLYHHWSSYSLKQRVTLAVQIFAILGFLCLPVISIVALVLTLAVLNMSLGIRKLYVKILTFLFDYATQISKDKEIPFDSNLKTAESPTPQIEPQIIDNVLDDWVELSPNTFMINESKTEQSITSEEENQRISRASSQTDIQFKLSDIIDYTRQGLEAIVDDEVTKRFTSANEMAVWNLLTRTQQQHGSFSIRVTVLWFIGFLIRYFILFPIRICLFFLAIFWVLGSIIFLRYVPKQEMKLRFGFYINIVLHRILSRVFSAIITYHNTEHRAKCGSICVANHTSPIDVIILSTDNGFSMIGQKHGGFFGIVQKTLSQTANHIWFERSEAKDRHMVAQKMREHIKNETNLPILIFPEGTCINNTSVMMFKKGCFEISEAPIYPVAIKYDNRFGDAFWNSSKHELVQYLILMMTSWAIVVDVYYLPPMKIEKNELSMDFARRVKAAIAKQGGFVDLEWDGGLKRSLPKADFREEEQRKFYEMLKTD
ncbi:unnamed protein product [Adineta steineri]|uniref:Phospholipid/glycerol acyltransferase domain-containing protein n=1 Tax=Adineta steineri TaxID=433720 RepID=A0A814B3R2_9BILA|nr:unnamed protein product [Adineta steineri]CAF0922693.1 unnamed protein product [Adineta steineri]